MFIRLVSLAFVMGFATASHAALSAGDQTGSRPEVMLVGTYHLANNNRDIINLPRKCSDLEEATGNGRARPRPRALATHSHRR